MKSLYKYFIDNNKNMIHKWNHYFEVYEKYFQKYVDQKIVMIEIGVAEGGSAQMWEYYFGKQATIIGIDINPDCKLIEKDNIFIEIGDQSNINFLQNIIEKYGRPDIILDDGSHVSKHQIDTFNFLYYAMKDEGIYLVEDTHTSYWKEWGGGLHDPLNFIEFSKSKIDELNAFHLKEQENKLITNFTKVTKSINFYDSIVVFEKRPQQRKTSIKTGNIYNE